MVKMFDECVNCEDCRHCGLDQAKHLYCDLCGDDVEELYQVTPSEQLCESCLLQSFDKISIDDI